MKKVNIILCIVIIILIILIFYYNGQKKKNDILYKQNLASTTLLTNNDKKYISLNKVSFETDYTIINAEYPTFTVVDEKYNQDIKNFIDELIIYHNQLSIDNWKAKYDTQTKDYPVSIKPASSTDKFPFTLQFEKSNLSDKYLSFNLRYYGFTGGAHGYEIVKSFNYDKINKKDISLNDYLNNKELNKNNFSFKYIQNFARENLNNKFITSDINDEIYLQNIKNGIIEGTAKIEDFSNFVFNDYTLKIFFAQYQIGPYTFGLPEVEIK